MPEEIKQLKAWFQAYELRFNEIRLSNNENIFLTKNKLEERWILLTTRLPSITTDGIHAKLDSSNTTCEACTAASLPDAMATLQSASFKASTSLPPSPVNATVCPASFKIRTNFRF